MFFLCWFYFLTFIVSCNESQDVFVSQHDCLVDLCFSEPGAFLSGWEDLHGHISSSPLPPPHFTKPTFTDDLLQHDGPGHCPLYKQGQTYDRRAEISLCSPWGCFKDEGCWKKKSSADTGSDWFTLVLHQILYIYRRTVTELLLLTGMGGYLSRKTFFFSENNNFSSHHIVSMYWPEPDPEVDMS